ncbi:MAG TPA: hypothetical protein DER26_03020 [Verrucomicrobia bacterium]|mgnify:FL=1|nr:hypothetical protein [Verrucomicrobiota bacterium]
MSLARGKFGIEFDPLRDEERPSGRGILIGAAVLVVLVSFAATLVNRLRARTAGNPDAGAAVLAEVPRPAPSALPAPPLSPAVPPGKALLEERPRVVRNLLMRLTEAERDRDLSRQVETIELLRAQPGNPTADIDHELVKRLGRLNFRWMFGGGGSPWTAEVTPRKGNSAARIAKEQGMTVAALLKLNRWRNVDEMRPGSPVRVLNRPNFTLVVHRRSQLAELILDGKLFKAYELARPSRAAPGFYRTTDDPTRQFARLGLSFSPADFSELSLFLLASTPVLVAEY